MEKKCFKFEDLVVYRKSIVLVREVYALTSGFPIEERFNLTSQFRRAATSIPLNIAEGNGTSNRENSRFISIAQRSLNECVVCITLAEQSKYITGEQSAFIRGELIEISKMLTSLRNYLNTSVRA